MTYHFSFQIVNPHFQHCIFWHFDFFTPLIFMTHELCNINISRIYMREKKLLTHTKPLTSSPRILIISPTIYHYKSNWTQYLKVKVWKKKTTTHHILDTMFNNLEAKVTDNGTVVLLCQLKSILNATFRIFFKFITDLKFWKCTVCDFLLNLPASRRTI